ncbi:hypothetical protein [Methylocystis suflitae]|uniref:hypothetical protein n=1 Tax=Methylocystis suflitae TaxID=2951405 RepID=UPI00210E8F27|nr:hypothetical protein [Methylocystis suflitae]MCQ4189928.1 hypothetical protein [Methylocystis suflitae]
MSSINPADAIGGATMRALEHGLRMLDGAVRLYEALALIELPDLSARKLNAWAEPIPPKFPRDAEVANYRASLRNGGTPIAQRLDCPGAPRGEHVGQR